MRIIRLAAVFLSAIAMSVTAGAAIIWDYSPDTTGSDGPQLNWTNAASGQNFAESFSFGADTLVQGMDIYMQQSFPTVGDFGRVKIWSDLPGQPGANLASFVEPVTIIDNEGTLTVPDAVRVHVDFSAPFLAMAGTIYWIGLSSDNDDVTWTQMGLSNNAPEDSRMWQFDGFGPAGFLAGDFVGDMAFRLHGDGAVVPEPATLALIGTGLVGFALSRRRKTH